MLVLSTAAGTLASGEEFVEEQLIFSTADIKMIEFFGEIGESWGAVAKPEEEPQRFRLLDGDLFAVVEDQLPLKAEPLTEDAGVFKIVGLGR